MYERFTDRSRKVMQLANQEAQRLGHEYIATEHILLGLVKEGAGVAANVLKNLGVDPHKVRTEVKKLLVPGLARTRPEPPHRVGWLRRLVGSMTGSRRDRLPRTPHTPYAKKVIEYAIEEAQSLSHNYVGTEHLLLGLLRENGGVASEVLKHLGIEHEHVRREVMNLLGAA